MINRIISALIRRYQWYIRDVIARRPFQNLKILDSFESIQYIIDHQCSVSRYGDGEFGLLWGCKIGFQDVDEKLVESLKYVLQATDAPNHVVGIPFFLKNVEGTVKLTCAFWGDFVSKFGKRLRPFLYDNRKYIDTQISRFYIEYHDRERSTRQLNLLKKIWEGRDVVIVEGAQSRTGVGNDLYDNVRSLQRILGYSKNAFSHYDEMLRAITLHVKPEEKKLILLSYGPTATILAYDLAKLGYQAVDMGHLDIEYEWYRRGTKKGEKIEGKYTNEAKDGDLVLACRDEKYLSQIICNITKIKID